MPQLLGLFKDSGGVPIATGKLRIRLDAPLIDISTTPDSLYLQEPAEFTITNGAIVGTVTLLESATQQITYEFTLYKNETQEEFYFADGTQYFGPTHQHTDTLYYTGYQHRTESVLLDRFLRPIPTQIDQFHAIVPNQATVEYSALLPTRVSTDKLPATIRQLADLLTTEAQYLQALRGGPNSQGAYSPTTYYQLDDWVSYNGSSYVYVNAISTAGNTPPNATYWQLVAAKGDTGTGTAGNDAAYNEAAWNGQTDAPSRNAVRDIIEQLARTSQLASYAPINNAALTGNPTRATAPAFGDRSTAIPTTNWVGSEFATIANPTFTGNPARSTDLALTNYSNQFATTKFAVDYFASQQFGVQVIAAQATSITLTNNAYVTVPFSATEIRDPNNLFNNTTGAISLAVTGEYRISGNISVLATTTLTYVEVAIMNGATRVASLGAVPGANIAGAQAAIVPFMNELTLSTGITYTIAVRAGGTGTLSVYVDSTTVNRLVIERVA